MKIFLLSNLVLSTVASLLHRQTSGQTTWKDGDSSAHDIENKICAPLTVIYARGTFEPGTIGNAIGQTFFKALSDARKGNVVLQGVKYPATLLGNLNYGADGGPNMTYLEGLAKKQCPTTKIALAGYSQGGYVIHDALNNRSLPVADVGALITFGDPGTPRNFSFGNPPVSANRIKQYCNKGDNICEGGNSGNLTAHGAYATNGATQDAAQFILRTVGLT